MVKEKLVLSKAKTDILEDQIKLLKDQKPIQGQRLAQTMPVANTNSTTTVSKLEEKEISQAQNDRNLSSTLTSPSFSI